MKNLDVKKVELATKAAMISYTKVIAQQVKLRMSMMMICFALVLTVSAQLGKDQSSLKQIKGGAPDYVIARPDSIIMMYREPFGQELYVFKNNKCTSLHIITNDLKKLPTLPDWTKVYNRKNYFELVID
jgi:hypothetical protein